jgi:protein-disulfide isomerase
LQICHPFRQAAQSAAKTAAQKMKKKICGFCFFAVLYFIMQIGNRQNLTKQERRELRRQEKEQENKQLHRQRFIKRFFLWSFVVLLVSGAVFGLIKLSANISPVQTASLINSISPSDWSKGNAGAKVVLVEYSDFQCPACASYYPLVKQLSQEFADDVAFVYRHFPLGRFPHSRIAAQAAEAVGKQGKFWEMHGLIFENQRQWSDQRNAKDIFISYAQSLQLDTEQFKNDLNSKEVEDKVNSDRQGGVRAGVNATPTFFLNGEKLQNPRNYDEFRNIINQALGNNP